MPALNPTPCDDGVIAAKPPGAPCPPASAPWVLAAAVLGSGMAFIDGSALNVALPAIEADLGASVAQAQWVVNAYALLLAALVLVGGSAGDRFGRRRVFVGGVALFTLASVACGLAPTAGALVAARAVQGVGAAFLVPGSLALIGANFAGAARGRAIGTWAGAGAITAALGPVLGGWLVDAVSWRAIFLINVPLALATVWIALRSVPESRDPAAASSGLDWPGALLATAGLGALAYGLTEAPGRGLAHPLVLASLGLGAAALAGFLVAEARGAAPMMPLALYRSRDFAGANLLTLLLYAALAGALFLLPFNLIGVQGYSATAAGAALLPFPLLMGLLSRWAGGLVGRRGARLPLAVGPAVAAGGLALMALPGVGGPYWTTFFPAVVVLGFGMTVAVAPLTATVMGAVDEHFAGTASGVNNAVARVAGLLAVAALGYLFLAVFDAGLAARLDRLGELPPGVRDELAGAGAGVLAGSIPAGADWGERGPELRAAVQAAYLGAFRVVVLATAALALAGGLCAWAMIGRSDGRRLSASTG